MKLLFVCICIALPLNALLASIGYEHAAIYEEENVPYLAAIEKKVEQKGAFDTILNLLPLYGWVKARNIINKRNLDRVYVI